MLADNLVGETNCCALCLVDSIHATLGSTMGTFQSPADPIFWSHHVRCMSRGLVSPLLGLGPLNI